MACAVVDDVVLVLSFGMGYVAWMLGAVQG
jgi:hypothetical protein